MESGSKLVFVSYSRKDEPIVMLLRQVMRATGTEVWCDIHSIDPGADWEAELHAALMRADIFAVFWSRNAAASEWVEKEYRMALQGTARIIPIRIDDTPLPLRLQKFQAIDGRKIFATSKSEKRRVFWTAVIKTTRQVAALTAMCVFWIVLFFLAMPPSLPVTTRGLISVVTSWSFSSFLVVMKKLSKQPERESYTIEARYGKQGASSREYPRAARRYGKRQDRRKVEVRPPDSNHEEMKRREIERVRREWQQLVHGD